MSKTETFTINSNADKLALSVCVVTPDSGRRWTHTRTDLIEMIYIVFLTADL